MEAPDDLQVSQAEVNAAFDHVGFNVEDVGSEKEWALTVPALTVMYIWAWADTDDDGEYGEPGEYAVSIDAATAGRYSSGNADASGITLPLEQVSE